jgi:hypothetical protein
VVIAADVQLNDRDLPLCEDGHRWFVLVADALARMCSMSGSCRTAMSRPPPRNADSAGQRHAVVHERTPQQLRTFVIAYERAENARQVSTAYYPIERGLRRSSNGATTVLAPCRWLSAISDQL